MKKIAILSSLGIGDIISLGPLTKKLKEAYPESKITVYSFKGGYIEDLAPAYIDEIEKLGNVKDFFKFLKEKKDLLISLGYYSNISGRLGVLPYYLVNLLSNSKKKIFHGELDLPNFRNKNMVQIKLDILKKIGIPINNEDYELFLPFSFEKERKEIDDLLVENKIIKDDLFVVLHAGIKKNYSTRFWQNERWADIVNYLVSRCKAKIGFIGGEEDIKKTEEIAEGLKFPVLNLTGKLSMKETAALIGKCDLFISTNSGPMWIAAALGKPQIALCGPSKPAWEPYNKKAVVIRKFLDRKHCNPPCDAKFCRYGDNLCMEAISTEEVIESIKEMIEK